MVLGAKQLGGMEGETTRVGNRGFSFFLLILARSNFDHYARECNFGILKKKQKQNKKTKTKQKTKKSFGCVFN